jgi:hypothetical protein
LRPQETGFMVCKWFYRVVSGQIPPKMKFIEQNFES